VWLAGVLRGRECGARALLIPRRAAVTRFLKNLRPTLKKKYVVRLFFLLADERLGRIYREKVNDERSFASLHRTRSYFFERLSPSPFSCADLRERDALAPRFVLIKMNDLAFEFARRGKTFAPRGYQKLAAHSNFCSLQ
jgi:hypothetical protein